MKHRPAETGVSRQANDAHLRRHEAVGDTVKTCWNAWNESY